MGHPLTTPHRNLLTRCSPAPQPQTKDLNNKLICSRPNCQRLAQPKAAQYYQGLCDRHARAAGLIKPRVDVTLAQKELERLYDGGWIHQHIIKATGINNHALIDISRNRVSTTRQSTLDRLKNLPTLSPYQRHAWPLIRRIQSLRGIGITAPELREALGVTQTQLHGFMHKTIKWVPVETDAAIRDYFEQHKMDTPRKVSEKIKYLRLPRPMQWENIDDPNEPWPQAPRDKKAPTVETITASPLFYKRFHSIVEHVGNKNEVMKLLRINIHLLKAWTSDTPPETVTINQYRRVNYHAKRIPQTNTIKDAA